MRLCDLFADYAIGCGKRSIVRNRTSAQYQKPRWANEVWSLPHELGQFLRKIHCDKKIVPLLAETERIRYSSIVLKCSRRFHYLRSLSIFTVWEMPRLENCSACDSTWGHSPEKNPLDRFFSNVVNTLSITRESKRRNNQRHPVMSSWSKWDTDYWVRELILRIIQRIKWLQMQCNTFYYINNKYL